MFLGVIGTTLRVGHGRLPCKARQKDREADEEEHPGRGATRAWWQATMSTSSAGDCLPGVVTVDEKTVDQGNLPVEGCRKGTKTLELQQISMYWFFL